MDVWLRAPAQHLYWWAAPVGCPALYMNSPSSSFSEKNSGRRKHSTAALARLTQHVARQAARATAVGISPSLPPLLAQRLVESPLSEPLCASLLHLDMHVHCTTTWYSTPDISAIHHLLPFFWYKITWN